MVGGNNFPQRLGRRLLLLVYDLFIPIVFVLGAYIAFLLVYDGHEPNRLLMMGLLAGILLAWMLNQLVNFIFSPHRSSSRLTPLNDADSQLLSSRVSWIFIGGSFLYFFQNYLGAISSPFESPELVQSVSLVGGIILIATIITVMWLIRRPVSTMLLAGRPPGGGSQTFNRYLANHWNSNRVIAICVRSVQCNRIGRKRRADFGTEDAATATDGPAANTRRHGPIDT